MRARGVLFDDGDDGAESDREVVAVAIDKISNASGGDIKKYGGVVTMLEGSDGNVGCGWTACAVTRPLHSVSNIAGPDEGPGVQEVMFNNRIGVVMPPGLVGLLLEHIKPVARHPWRGGLYVGDFEMSSSFGGAQPGRSDVPGPASSTPKPNATR